ncbi:MAG: hypothetical protein AAF481_10360 [Acidobacteriota bacterium]
MKPIRYPLLCFVLLLFATSVAATAEELTVDRPSGVPGEFRLAVETVTVEGPDRQEREVEVESGTWLVPENRRRPEGPAVSIPFYRLRSTAPRPAPPIFLLAGGPGSSWIDRFENPENFAEAWWSAVPRFTSSPSPGWRRRWWI